MIEPITNQRMNPRMTTNNLNDLEDDMAQVTTDTIEMGMAMTRAANVNVARVTSALPTVVYFDDVIEQFKDDDTGLPPIEDDDDNNHELVCVYAYDGIESDNDFADLRNPKAAERDNCQEKPEYYIKAYPSDPGAEDAQLETYYYCPRHFAMNLGYLCDTMARRTPDMEIKRFMAHGELPPRYTIQEWGPIASL